MIVFMVWRGLRKRCAACGQRVVFTGWGRLEDTCRRCGLQFEREEGYWLGAMIVNIAVTELAFLAVFVGGMLVTWPEVPWGGLLVAALTTNLLVPILFYARSKTTWVALDLGVLQRMHPGDGESDRSIKNAV